MKKKEIRLLAGHDGTAVINVDAPRPKYLTAISA
jgi:hypothetical protein